MTTSYQLADMFLQALGAPINTGTRRAVSIWLKFESGGNVTGNNPWNLHSGPACPASKKYCPGNGNLPGQIGNRYAGSGDRNVAVFDTLEHGVQANARNLQNLAGSGYGYDKVIAAFRSGNGFAALRALQFSSWSAGHYGYKKLTQAFLHGGSYNYNLSLSPGTGHGSGGGSGGGSSGGSGGGGENTGFQPGFDWGRITTTVLQQFGISTESTHTINHDEALKLATLFPGSQYPAEMVARQFEGKTVGELLNLAKGINIDVGGAIEAVGKQLQDTFIWIGVIILGVVLIGGGIFLFGIAKADELTS